MPALERGVRPESGGADLALERRPAPASGLADLALERRPPPEIAGWPSSRWSGGPHRNRGGDLALKRRPAPEIGGVADLARWSG